MTPDSRNGQSTKIYPLVSPVSLPTTASGTTATSCDTYHWYRSDFNILCLQPKGNSCQRSVPEKREGHKSTL